jgi:hypothetical protein
MEEINPPIPSSEWFQYPGEPGNGALNADGREEECPAAWRRREESVEHCGLEVDLQKRFHKAGGQVVRQVDI